jgi:hypothetical protein
LKGCCDEDVEISVGFNDLYILFYTISTSLAMVSPVSRVFDSKHVPHDRHPSSELEAKLFLIIYLT